MTTRSLRIGAALAAATALAVTLAACTAPGSTTSSGSETGIVNSSAKPPTGQTLTIWASTADTPALKDLYKAYEKESGNKLDFVEIPADSFGLEINSKWATGARPDILEWQGNDADALGLNMPKNALALTSLPFVKKEGGLAKLSGYADGQTYAATLGPNLIYGIYYNKSLFTSAGLQPPKDYSDLASDCTALKQKDPGVSAFFEAGGSSFPPQALASFLYTSQYNVNASYANDIIKGTKKLTDPSGPFLKGLEAYESFKKSGCFNSDTATATWPQQTQALLDGKTAMIAEDSNSITQLIQQAGGSSSSVASKIGFVPVSATEALGNTSPDPVGTYYLPKTNNTTHEKAAVGFIDYITSSSAYQKYVDEAGIIPNLSGTKTPHLTGLWKDAAAAVPGAGLTLNSAIPGFGNQFGTQSDALLAGQETPQQVASKMQTYVEQALTASGQ